MKIKVNKEIMDSKQLDQVILVDENDQQVGTMDKVDAHRGEGIRHRAISVFLFNDQDELLIQQRSSKKIVGAGQWANTCCGNVRPNETYAECAVRRLQEELGITGVELRSLHKFEYHTPCNDEFSEWEIDTVFIGEYNAIPQPNPDEVAATAWKDTHTLRQEMAADKQQHQKITDQKYAPWFHILCEQPPVASILQ